MTTEEVREILRMAQLPVSLEKPIGEEEESELGDFVQDDAAESPVRLGLAQPPPRGHRQGARVVARPRAQGDRAPLRARGEQPRTLEEVGRAFGVTRERIRQIENNTLKKLESLPEAQGSRTACRRYVGRARGQSFRL